MKNARALKMHRQSSKGATRKAQAVAKRPASFAWLNRVLILVAGGAVLTVAVKGFVALNAIPVEHIIVAGNLQHTKTEALEELIRPALVGGFLNVDLDYVRTQLQSLPWVHEVSVRRRWPNALELQVVEQLPIARWGTDGFLNHEGVVFQSHGGEDDWSGLPVLRGPQESAGELMAIYQRIMAVLAPCDLIVQELAIDDRGQVEVELRGGMRLVLGGRDHVERLRRFVALYRIDPGRHATLFSRVDLRYQNGLAITYRETEHVVKL